MTRSRITDSLRRRVRDGVPALTRRDAEIARLTTELQAARRRLDEQTSRSGDDPGPWRPPAGGAARRLVRRSGILDTEWYREQVAQTPEVPTLDDDSDLARHYLQHGAAAGLSPHPAFLASWYRSRTDAIPESRPGARTDSSPLLHFLAVGARQGLSPHPALDAAEYLAEHPDSAEDPLGPLGHLLGSESARGGDVPLEDSVTQLTPATRTATELVSDVRTIARRMLATRGTQHLRRERTSFDHDAAEALKQDLRSDPLPDDPPPLVSVIVPTKDRAAVLGTALDSVLAQTWQAWELIVVDDGSTDETDELLGSYDEPRLVVVRHDQARGVAAARNAGLDRARGTYVAYLDSDNTWEPDFLEIVVRFLLREGHRAAYGTSALVEVGGRGRRRYRGMPFSRHALRERNYIDCIALVHERSLLEVTGGFDETLRRTVDWDLFIRLADHTDLVHLPVIATTYDIWDTGGSRISHDESVGYRYRVMQRPLVDWEDALDDVSSRVAGRTSVVLVSRESAVRALDTVRRCLATTTDETEVVLVDAGLPEAEHARLLLGVEGLDRVVVHRLGPQVSLEVARNVGACRSSGDVLVFVPDGAWFEPHWLSPLLAALEDHAAVQPVVLTRGGAIWSAGLHVSGKGRGLPVHRALPGDAPEARGLRAVDTLSAACLAVPASTFVAAEGFDPMVVDAWSGGELPLRAADATGRPLACVGASRVALLADPETDLRPWELRQRRANDLVLAEAWGARDSLLEQRLADDGFRADGLVRDEHADPDGRLLLLHDRPDRPMRWSIKIGPPDVPARENWGDWHFAEALGASLERLGHVVGIDAVDEWYRPTGHLDDVVLTLRGLSYLDPAPGQVNLMWLISHSDRVTPAELRAYDRVFGASERWCSKVSRHLERPALPLLQCTDHRRFHPVPHDPEHAEEVLVVANARDAGRPTVDAALEAGVVPAVYGARWQDLLPAGAWRGHYVPNDELVSYYASAGVVLNDHHEDMRRDGFLSNRLFDLTACGARVLSDHLPELHDVFGDVVASWSEPSQIPALVDGLLTETPAHAERRARLSEHVRAHHTFDARAAQLSEVATGLLRDARRSPVS